MRLSLIAAVDEKGGIGYQNGLPWRLPADLAYFREKTLGKPILMGRKTFESIGRPLPGRRNIVLSQQNALDIPGCEVFSSLEAVLQATSDMEELMVIGGATIYSACLPYAQRLYLTMVHANVPVDTFFPVWNPQEWAERFREDCPADTKNMYKYSFVVLDHI